MKKKLCGSKSGYLSNSGTLSPPVRCPQSLRDLTCSSIQRRAVFSASVVWALGMTAGCQVRMRKKRCFL
ncbi:unnamed protein product [Staurois parvus]|uniref:Uncharacterized protein n=1 Tax=Staurois parvus TaxID=386267 RepID=A0ABN9EY66_9NEOB|nr:unnamed protein product [Staurois parvus]